MSEQELEGVVGHLDGLSGAGLHGWVWNPANQNQRLTVEMYVDGRLAGTAKADRHRPDLAAGGIGDGCYAFLFEMPAEYCDDAEHEVMAVVRETHALLVDGRRTFTLGTGQLYRGAFDGVRDGMACGWAYDRRSSDNKVIVSIRNGTQEVGRGAARYFRLDLNRNRVGYGFHAFAIPLPPAILDGRRYDLKAYVAGTDVSLDEREIAFQAEVAFMAS
ncbi:MAG TPA: hypothetical protein VGE72_12455 [Azospirillum sp.]